ncbi:DHH family phosphoesterase [bacterium]|nr:DHH family phosphoesterase [bacterium]
MDNTTKDISKFQKLIEESNSILVVCHTGADPDALGSTIALKKILTEYYNKQNVIALGERIPASLAFIPGYNQIINGSILEILEKNAIDLLICLDFGQTHLASKTDSQQIQELLTKSGIPIVVIDHHPDVGQSLNPDIYLNLDPTSTSTNLHLIFHKNLKYPILPSVADHLLIGIIADTNRFKFKYGATSQASILRIAAELLDHSTMSIEEISNTLERFELASLQYLPIFIKNITFLEDTFVYTSLSEEEITESELDKTKLGSAASYFANIILTMVDNAKRGFIIYPHLLEEDTYTVRFRSCDPNYPVDEYAIKLGAGGHKQSAAARVKARNKEEAIAQVLKVITD